MSALAKYDQAKRALAEAKTLADVKAVKGLAAAIEALGRIARDRAIIADAVELTTNADRKLGEMLKAAKAAGQIAVGRNWQSNGSDSEPLERITLEDAGIDKKLSSRAQRIAEIEPDAYEQMLAQHREAILKGRNVSFDTAIREDKKERLRAAHRARTYEGGTVEDLEALAASGFRAKVCGIDPQWKFQTRGEHGDGRSAGQHYDTEETDAIADMIERVLPCLDDDAMIAMWTVDWNMHAFFALVQQFDLTIVTKCFNWVKLLETHDGTPRAADGRISDADFPIGNGYYTRANPEDCWLLKRGRPQPVLDNAVRQLIVAPVMEHSRKPDLWLDGLERMFAGPYLEINARRPRDGWISWGNELPFVMPGEALPYDGETGEIYETESQANADNEAAGHGQKTPAVESVSRPATVRSVAPFSSGLDEAQTSASGVTAGETATSSQDMPEIPSFLRRTA